MKRKKIIKIVVFYHDDTTLEVSGNDKDVPLTDTSVPLYDEKGEYKYSAMFWHETAISPLLSKYYPARGVELTEQMCLQRTRDGRVHAEVPIEPERSGSTDGDDFYARANSIYPEDILHLWKHGYKNDCGSKAKPIQPSVLLKASKSPVKPSLVPVSLPDGAIDLKLVRNEDGDVLFS